MQDYESIQVYSKLKTTQNFIYHWKQFINSNATKMALSFLAGKKRHSSYI